MTRKHAPRLDLPYVERPHDRLGRFRDRGLSLTGAGVYAGLTADATNTDAQSSPPAP